MNKNQEAIYLINFLAKKVKKLERENKQLRNELEIKEELKQDNKKYFLVSTDQKYIRADNFKMAVNIYEQQKNTNPELKQFNNLEEMNRYISNFKPKKSVAVKTTQKQTLSVKQKPEPVKTPTQTKKENDRNKFYNDKKLAQKKGYETFFYVDGSVHLSKKLFSSAFVMEVGDEYVKEQSYTFSEKKAKGNCMLQSAELTATMLAVIEAKTCGLKKFAIVYDRADIFTHYTNKPEKNVIGISFYNWMKRETKGMDIKFIKAKSHCGINGNEKADSLAVNAIHQPKKIHA